MVEDNFVLAESMKWALQELGCVVIGPASTTARAIELVESEGLDAAILDVDLQGTTSMPVAKVLRERGRPFLFLTGFDSSSLLPEELQGALGPRIGRHLWHHLHAGEAAGER